MTATYPKVQAFKKDNPIQIRPGIAGKVALIGVSIVKKPPLFIILI